MWQQVQGNLGDLRLLNKGGLRLPLVSVTSHGLMWLLCPEKGLIMTPAMLYELQREKDSNPCGIGLM